MKGCIDGKIEKQKMSERDANGRHGPPPAKDWRLFRTERTKACFSNLFINVRKSGKECSPVWRSSAAGREFLLPRSREWPRFLSSLLKNRKSGLVVVTRWSLKIVLLYAENTQLSLSLEERITYEGNTWRESSRRKLIRLISIIISLVNCVRLPVCKI